MNAVVALICLAPIVRRFGDYFFPNPANDRNVEINNTIYNNDINVWKYIVITELVVSLIFVAICAFWYLQFGYTPIHTFCDWLSDDGSWY